jgi:hypothetical protein
MKVGTTYHFVIGAGVRTAAGDSLGQDLAIRFTTLPLSAQAELPDETNLGGIPFADITFKVSFNECVRYDAFHRAVSFQPVVEGDWLPEAPCAITGVTATPASTSFSFFPAQPLSAGQSYELMISDTIPLTDGTFLPQLHVTEFSTEPYGVVDVFPVNGVPWAVVGNKVSLTFNTVMNQATTEEAFTLTEFEGDEVAGSFRWEMSGKRLIFDPASLRAGHVYHVFLSREAQTETGQVLSQDFESFFAVR